MAITLTSTNGLFTRLGKILQVADVIKTHQGTLNTEIQDAIDEFSKADLYMVDALVGSNSSAQRSAATYLNTLRQACEQTVIEMVNADNPQPDKSLRTALVELIAQMDTASASVDGETTSASDSAGSGNTGTGELETSLKSWQGDALQNVRAEDIVLTCIRDSSNAGVTAGREFFSVKGEAPVTDITSADWPGGSGINATIRVTDPAEDAGSGPGRNLLTNSDFEDFTVANTPDNWTIVNGTVGTHILEENSTVFKGSSALEIRSTSSTLAKIKQTVTLKPQTQYLLSFKLDVESGISTGTLKVNVKDSASVINGGAAEVSVDLSGPTAGTWVHHATTFVTPASVKAPEIAVEWTAADVGIKSAFVDHLVLCEMQQFGGDGGPYIAIINGDEDFVIDDTFTISVTNNRAGEFAEWFDRFFGMYQLGLQLPFDTSGSETIADTLIA